MATSHMLPVFDGHNDTLLHLYLPERGRSFFEQSECGHIDLPRARIGGFGGGFFAVFVPSPTPSDYPLAIILTRVFLPLWLLKPISRKLVKEETL